MMTFAAICLFAFAWDTQNPQSFPCTIAEVDGSHTIEIQRPLQDLPDTLLFVKIADDPSGIARRRYSIEGLFVVDAFPVSSEPVTVQRIERKKRVVAVQSLPGGGRITIQ